jgi:thiol-disulfide isomerase/thioredoxin
MRLLVALSFAGVFGTCTLAQPSAPPGAAELKEETALAQAVSEAGSSAVDLIRALEMHLGKYPATKQRAAIEKGLAKAAMDSNDDARIILYGEKVLHQESPDDMTLIDRVTRALVEKNDPDQAKRALEYANRYGKDVLDLRARQQPPGHLTAGQWSEELDHAMARALALKARATGYAGDPAGAAKIALQSWAACPTGEGAREAGFWLTNLGRTAEAIEFYANAFSLEDARTTEADRARDRTRLGGLYAKLNGSEKGLGDAILQAYDRTSALLSERSARLKEKDPNAQATNIVDFILNPVDDTLPPLRLSSLKGKTVVVDFWATWCVPCRTQQPMIEKVKKHFADASNVVFLAVDTDDDPSLVVPFVKEQGWKDRGYFDAGLARHLEINSIPTILVLDPASHISSRMTGLIPERFEQMLTERIEDARGVTTSQP